MTTARGDMGGHESPLGNIMLLPIKTDLDVSNYNMRVFSDSEPTVECL